MWLRAGLQDDVVNGVPLDPAIESGPTPSHQKHEDLKFLGQEVNYLRRELSTTGQGAE
jgi:hypothetical protein